MSKKVKIEDKGGKAPPTQHELPEHDEAKTPEVKPDKHDKHEKHGKAEMDVEHREEDPNVLIHRAFATLGRQPVH